MLINLIFGIGAFILGIILYYSLKAEWELLIKRESLLLLEVVKEYQEQAISKLTDKFEAEITQSGKKINEKIEDYSSISMDAVIQLENFFEIEIGNRIAIEMKLEEQVNEIRESLKTHIAWGEDELAWNKKDKQETETWEPFIKDISNNSAQQMFEEGVPLRKIAKAFGHCYSYWHRLAKKEGWDTSKRQKQNRYNISQQTIWQAKEHYTKMNSTPANLVYHFGGSVDYWRRQIKLGEWKKHKTLKGVN